MEYNVVNKEHRTARWRFYVGLGAGEEGDVWKGDKNETRTVNDDHLLLEKKGHHSLNIF